MNRAIAIAAVLTLCSRGIADDGAMTEARAAADAKDFTRAASILRAHLASSPEDDAARFLLARALYWNGDRAAALTEYDRLIARHPEDSDYRLGQAWALWWEGRTEEARRALERAVASSPASEDAHRLLVRVLRRTGDRAALDAAVAAADRAYPDRPAGWAASAAPEDLAASRSALPTWEVEAGVSAQRLRGGRDDWRTEYAEVLVRYAPRDAGPSDVNRSVAGLRLEDVRRYGTRDTRAEGTLSFPADDRWTLLATVSASPEHRFLEKWKAETGAARALGDGWIVTAVARRAEYSESVADAIAVTAEKYVAEFRIAWTTTASRVRDAGTGDAHRIAFDRSYGEGGRSRAGLAFGVGTDVESVGRGAVARSDVWSAALVGRHRLGGGWAATWEVSVERSDALGTRSGGLLGLRFEF